MNDIRNINIEESVNTLKSTENDNNVDLSKEKAKKDSIIFTNGQESLINTKAELKNNSKKSKQEINDRSTKFFSSKAKENISNSNISIKKNKKNKKSYERDENKVNRDLFNLLNSKNDDQKSEKITEKKINEFNEDLNQIPKQLLETLDNQNNLIKKVDSLNKEKERLLKTESQNFFDNKNNKIDSNLSTKTTIYNNNKQSSNSTFQQLKNEDKSNKVTDKVNEISIKDVKRKQEKNLNSILKEKSRENKFFKKTTASKKEVKISIKQSMNNNSVPVKETLENKVKNEVTNRKKSKCEYEITINSSNIDEIKGNSQETHSLLTIESKNKTDENLDAKKTNTHSPKTEEGIKGILN